MYAQPGAGIVVNSKEKWDTWDPRFHDLNDARQADTNYVPVLGIDTRDSYQGTTVHSVTHVNDRQNLSKKGTWILGVHKPGDGKVESSGTFLMKISTNGSPGDTLYALPSDKVDAATGEFALSSEATPLFVASENSQAVQDARRNYRGRPVAVETIDLVCQALAETLKGFATQHDIRVAEALKACWAKWNAANRATLLHTGMNEIARVGRIEQAAAGVVAAALGANISDDTLRTFLIGAFCNDAAPAAAAVAAAAGNAGSADAASIAGMIVRINAEIAIARTPVNALGNDRAAVLAALGRALPPQVAPTLTADAAAWAQESIAKSVIFQQEIRNCPSQSVASQIISYLSGYMNYGAIELLKEIPKEISSSTDDSLMPFRFGRLLSLPNGPGGVGVVSVSIGGSS